MIYLSAVLGYLLGSVPFGLVLTKLAGYGDIRKIGSGNIGATNVLRTGNKFLALLTLILDGGKGAIAVIIVHYLTAIEEPKFFSCLQSYIEFMNAHKDEKFTAEMAKTVAGFAVVVGHMFPVWLKFKGGKGVATALGMYLALAPAVGAAACLTWLIMAAVFRYSSLSALAAMLLAPFAAWFVYSNAALAGLCAATGALVWLRHRANIKRLLKGEEPKIGRKKES